MGKSQRDKGCRGERLWRDMCRAAGFFQVKRGGQLYQTGKEIADCVGLPDVHQEVKFQERLNLRAAMEQSERDCREGEFPIVAHKTSRKEWLVTMRGVDWLKMFRGYRDSLEPLF